jgi:hypothetical protein
MRFDGYRMLTSNFAHMTGVSRAVCGGGHWISVVNLQGIYELRDELRADLSARVNVPLPIRSTLCDSITHLATATVEHWHEGQKQLSKRPSNIASKGRLNVQSTPPDPLIDRHHSLADTIKGR